MTDLFLKLLNMCISASWLALAVLAIRLIFKNMPRWISCILWGILALRLIFPVHLQSIFSLIPSPQVIPADIAVSQTPAIYSGIHAVNSAVNPLFLENTASPDKMLSLGTLVWLIGSALLLLYSLITYLKLHLQVRVSLNLRDNIYLCDGIDSPFLLGLIRPRIYVPSDLDEDSLQYVLLHENAHIKRRDHWWKPLGFLLLCIYWYNPLLWVAYWLLCRDIECACDEKVISNMTNSSKATYSAVLAACSIHPRLITACPVAFGEIGVKTRIKSILNYKKPTLWIILASVLICAVISLCFLTDPPPCQHEYTTEITMAATCTETGTSMHTCANCNHCYATHVDMISHTYVHSSVIKEPTCTESGIELLTCTDCGNQITAPLEKTPHTPNGQVFITEPNCTMEGEKAIACSICSNICYTEILPTNGVHDLHETVICEASCTSDGEGVLACSRCSYSEALVYPHTGHHYVETVYTQPTCMSLGAMKTECVICGDRFDTLLMYANHNFVSSGNRYEYCTGCGCRQRTNYVSPTSPIGKPSSTTPPTPVIGYNPPFP